MERPIVSVSPHIREREDVASIMRDVTLALLPTTIVGIAIFGISALWVILICIAAAVGAEALIQRAMGREITVQDGSAFLTGLLLALNLPAGAPLWLASIGSGIAIGLGKHIYGGLGHNPFNPALIARVILLVSWPVEMTRWPKPLAVDAVTCATPLGILKEEGVAGIQKISLLDCLLGNIGGCIGEVSALALLGGAAYLLYKGHIRWQIPVSFIGSVAALTTLFWLIKPQQFANPLFHILTGGLILGAFFMATDMVTSPLMPRGMLIFGVGCGIITVIIRLFGGYPEGVSFSILLMNALTPLLDKWKFTHPRKFGERRE